MEKLIERFLKYVQIDTQSSETAGTSPSTAKQRDLASLLADELRSAGASVTYDEKNCYVYACVPGSAPAIGFISHMDTSPDASGSHVKPRIIRSYDGKDKLDISFGTEQDGKRIVTIGGKQYDCSLIDGWCLPDYPKKDPCDTIADNHYAAGDSVTIEGWVVNHMPGIVRKIEKELMNMPPTLRKEI